MADRYIGLINGRLKGLVEANVTSAGPADAGKIVALDASGKLDMSLLPVGIGADSTTMTAMEALSAGDFVSVFSDSGTPKVRKADASAPSATRRAHGFVLQAAAAGAPVTVYWEGSNTALSGLTPGTTYALSHTNPGKVVELHAATGTPGHTLQVLGVAISSTVLSTEIGEPLVLA